MKQEWNGNTSESEIRRNMQSWSKGLDGHEDEVSHRTVIARIEW